MPLTYGVVNYVASLIECDALSQLAKHLVTQSYIMLSFFSESFGVLSILIRGNYVTKLLVEYGIGSVL